MTDLTWCCCPRCGEIGDLHRIGLPLRVHLKRKRGAAPAWAAEVLAQSISKQVRCRFCGTIFFSEMPTRKEAFGDDGVGDVPF